MINNEKRLPAEWENQAFVMFNFPHKNTDWNYMLSEVRDCYSEIIFTTLKYQKVLLICKDISETKTVLNILDNSLIYKNLDNTIQTFSLGKDTHLLTLIEIDSNDTWARDFSGITIEDNGSKKILDFAFNGWGLKFPADKDNLITNTLLHYDFNWLQNFDYQDCRKFILEGGSIESDGEGTILTTSKCLLSENRNYMSKEEIENNLRGYLGAKRILWLNNGYLSGDDTDSHVDTLARFCNPHTIAYVKCDDPNDSHYAELKAMEQELKEMKTNHGLQYSLIPLPMADKVIFDGERLPATYANFLIINDAVLLPVYNSPKDKIAIEQIKKAFPRHKVECLNCVPLIKQHGSIHCISMQFPL